MDEKHSSEKYAYLTTIGRNTNQPHRVELCFYEKDGKVYLLGHRHDDKRTTDWHQNLKRNQKCILQVLDQKYRCRAISLIEDNALENMISSAFRNKLGDDHFNTWYAGSNRVPVVLEILD